MLQCTKIIERMLRAGVRCSLNVLSLQYLISRSQMISDACAAARKFPLMALLSALLYAYRHIAPSLSGRLAH